MGISAPRSLNVTPSDTLNDFIAKQSNLIDGVSMVQAGRVTSYIVLEMKRSLTAAEKLGIAMGSIIIIMAFLLLICSLILCCTVYCTYRRRNLMDKYARIKDNQLMTKLLHADIASTGSINRNSIEIDRSLFEISFEDLKDLEEIGSGGSGSIVFKATLGIDTVVIKLFKFVETSAADIAKFEHEMRLLA